MTSQQNHKTFNTTSQLPSFSQTLIKTDRTLKSSRTTKTLTSEERQKRLNELYHQNEKWKAKKQKLRQEYNSARSIQDMKQCTFQPSINPEIQLYTTNGSQSFLKRQTDWAMKKERKINEMSEQAKRKLKKQCSFHPKISKKSYRILFGQKDTRTNSQLSFNLKEKNSDDNSVKKVNEGSYREIHKKKECFKELQKTGSFKSFTLMTERRIMEKNCPFQKCQTEQKKQKFRLLNDFSKQSAGQQLHETQRTDEDQIENIVIKSQEQDTFNSISSFEIKNQNRNEADEQKQPVKIFEEAENEVDEETNQKQDEQLSEQSEDHKEETLSEQDGEDSEGIQEQP